MSDLRVRLVLDAIDRATAPLRQLDRTLTDVDRHAAGATRGQAVLASAGRQALTEQRALAREEERLAAQRISGASASGLAIGGGIAATALAAGSFVSSMVKVNAQFEDYAAVLETTEGSAEKAQRALGWVSDFAARTPYELPQVTEAFVKLRTYGLDPMDGTLQTLGDTSAAMGKPLMQAVEAIADAVVGENKRLKEFGINAAKQHGEIVYSYVDQAGKQMTRTVDAANREQIQSTLTAIWNDRFQGAMDRRSRTWNGMMSNVSDQVTRFQQKVGASGAFGVLKEDLQGLLSTLDNSAASGEMDKLANVLGGGLADGLKSASEGFGALLVASGGAERAAHGIGGAFEAAGVAIGGVASAIGKVLEFEGRLEKFIGLDPSRFGVGALLTGQMKPLANAPLPLTYTRGSLGDRALRWLGAGDGPSAATAGTAPPASAAMPGTAPLASSVAGAAAAQRTEVGGKVSIEITAPPGTARVRDVSSTSPKVPVTVDQGFAFGVP